MLGHGCVQQTHIFFTNPRPLRLPPLIITPCTPISFTATAFLHQHLWIKNTHAQNHHHKEKAAAPPTTSAQQTHPQTHKITSNQNIQKQQQSKHRKIQSKSVSNNNKCSSDTFSTVWLHSTVQTRAKWWGITTTTSSTAQGGGGSFKKRKPIGEIGCCESPMAEQKNWWIELSNCVTD